MAELAQGLDKLERLGLAHGDPYPFNAIHNEHSAAWVDFGHMTDDPNQSLKDAWAFVLFTVLHTQRPSQLLTVRMLEKNLADALMSAAQPGRFARIRVVLMQSYVDLMPAGDLRQPSEILSRAFADV